MFSRRRGDGGGSDEYEPVRPPGAVEVANFSDPGLHWDTNVAAWEIVPGRRWSSSRIRRDKRTRDSQGGAQASEALRRTAPRDPSGSAPLEGQRVGNTTGLLCNLPMRFEGRWYDDCAPWNGGEWCLTVDKGWDLCNPQTFPLPEAPAVPAAGSASRVAEEPLLAARGELTENVQPAEPAELDEPCEDRWEGYLNLASGTSYGCAEWALEGGCQMAPLASMDCARTCGFCDPPTVGSLLDSAGEKDAAGEETLLSLLGVPEGETKGSSGSRLDESLAEGRGGGRGGPWGACAPPVMIFDFDGVLKYGSRSPGLAAKEVTERFLDMGYHIAVSTGSDFADYKQDFVQTKVSRRAFPDELWRSGAFVKNTRAKDFAIRSIMEFFGQTCDACVVLFDDNDYRWAARQSNTHLVRVDGGRGLLPRHYEEAMQYLRSECLAPQ